MRIRNFFTVLGLVLLPLSLQAQVKGKIVLNLLEGGGNGAAYGYIGLQGPTNRT